MEGVEDDLFKQAAIVWGNIVNILQELGCEMKDIVHRNVSFKYVFCFRRYLEQS